ncbi:MAG: glycoside hydrolase family 172 protein [Mariniphaga sp.]
MKKLRFSVFLMICLLTQIKINYAQNSSLIDHSLLQQLPLPSDGRSMRSSSTDANFDGNGDSELIQPGETLVLADLEGPGIIKHIWNTSGSLNPYSVRAMVIRIYWDNSDKPSVEVPLGDFFGVGQGTAKDYQSLPVNISSHGRARNCFWNMPFQKHAKITVSNEMAGFGPAYFYYYVDWEKVASLPKDILYFHARYNQQSPAKPGDHVILNTTGKGNYIGTVYSVLQVVNGWFGEGDDRFFIDGEKTPTIQGTGTEDYFGDAWGFREFAGSFNGVPMHEGPMAGDRVSAYRWHILDPIRFKKSLKFTIEHRGSVVDDNGLQHSSSGERADWVSSVAFWYQTPIAFSDSELPPAVERIPPYQIMLAANLKFKATPEKIEKEKAGINFVPEQPEGEIEFEFDVHESGSYKFSAVLVDNIFGSRYQPIIDHQPAGPVLDMMSKGGDWREFVFGVFKFEKGKHTFKLQGRGTSVNLRPDVPKKYAVGISSLSLLRIESL